MHDRALALAATAAVLATPLGGGQAIAADAGRQPAPLTAAAVGASIARPAATGIKPIPHSFTKASGAPGRPKISTRTPKPGATGVSRTANIVVKFNEAVECPTTCVKLKDTKTGAAIGGKLTVNFYTFKATLNPTATLKAKHTYTVTVIGAKDADGKKVLTTSWTFTTGS